jgi:hypothetical protein
MLSPALSAQDVPRKKKPVAAKKKAVPTQQQAHKKPTPEQIRKFNELQKKR